MELASRLHALKTSDVEAFLDASLASLRLIQNVLEHPHNERYRRLRGSAPILKHTGVIDVLEAVGFRFEDTQLVLPEQLMCSVDIVQHLTSCKYDIMAARRATGRKMGWEVPQNCIRVTAVKGSCCYGELYEALMDDKKVTIKMLQQMSVQSLRDQFSGEIDVLTQLKHPNVVELMGLVITAEPPSMIFESLSETMLDVLHREGLRKERVWGYLNQAVQGMEYIHSQGILHCNLAARNMFLDGYDTVKIGDFSRSKKVDNLDSDLYSDDLTENPFNVRWMAPEVLQHRQWSKEADIWSFGIVVYEFLTSGSVPYASLNNDLVCRKVVEGYCLPRPQTCPSVFHRLMEDCCAREPSNRPSFKDLLSTRMPALLGELKRPLGATSDESPERTAGTSTLTSRSTVASYKKMKEPSLNTILSKNGNLVRIFVGLVSHESSVVVCCLPKTTVQEAVTLALQKCRKFSGVESKFCKLVAVDVNLSPERPSQVLRRDNGIIAAKKQLENTYQFIIYNTRSDPYQSEHTIITEVVAAKKIRPASQFELRLEGHLVLNEEVDCDDYGRKQVLSCWKKIWCIVHEGTMFLYESEQDEKLKGFWQHLALNECRIQVIYENRKKISGFSLHFPSGHDFMFSSEVSEEMDMIEWIEAITTGRHLPPSSLLKESSEGVVIHAGMLTFQQCLDVGKVRMNLQREARAKSEEGVLDEGTSWIILHNNGMMHKVDMLTDDVHGCGQENPPPPEEWFSLSDVDSVEYSDCDNVSGMGYLIKITLPPSRFILKSDSFADHCQLVSAIRSVLTKSEREDIITVMTMSKMETLQRRRGTTVAAREVFRKPSVDFYTTYYIEPDEVMYSSSDESSECLETLKHRTSGASSDSGYSVDHGDYLQVLPDPVGKGSPKVSSSSATPIQVSRVKNTDKFFFQPKEICMCSLYQDNDDSDLYCDIEDSRRSSDHIYATISDFQQTLEGDIPTISEEEESEDCIFNDGMRQLTCSVGEDSRVQTDEVCLLPDHTHLQPDDPSLPQPEDHTHPQPDDLPQSQLECCLTEPEQYAHVETIKKRKECTTDSECPQLEDPQQEEIEKDDTESNCTSLDGSIQLEDDYIPMRSAAYTDVDPIPQLSCSLPAFRELTRTPSPHMFTRISPPLCVASPLPVPPPLPPRNYPKSNSSEGTPQVQKQMERNASISSLESAESDSPRLHRTSSFKSVKNLIGSILHGSSPQLHKESEVSDERKMMTVYKTAELCDNNGGITLWGSQRGRKKKISGDKPPTFGRKDGSKSPLLLTNRGTHGKKWRPPISAVFNATMPLQQAESMCSLSDCDEGEGILRTSSCSGYIAGSSFHRSHTSLVRSKSARSCNVKLDHSPFIASNTLRSTRSTTHCHIEGIFSNKLPVEKLKAETKQEVGSCTKNSEERSRNDSCESGVESPKISTDSIEVESCFADEIVMPPGWEKAADTETGKEYFFNRDVGITTWDYSKVQEFVKNAEKDPGSGWQPVVLGDGRKYFYHTATKQSTWNIKDTFEQTQQKQQQQQ